MDVGRLDPWSMRRIPIGCLGVGLIGGVVVGLLRNSLHKYVITFCRFKSPLTTVVVVILVAEPCHSVIKFLINLLQDETCSGTRFTREWTP